MDIVFALSLACLFIGCKFFWKGNNQDAFSFEQTNCINGFFVILIFIRHFFQYIEPNKLDRFSNLINLGLGQLIVVSFMFFSGYAIMLCIEKRKKDEYIKSIPVKCLQLWMRFVFVVLLFLLVGYLMGNSYDVKTILLSLFGLCSVGNSTWYCVAIICLWFFTYISFRFFKGNTSLLILAVLMLVYSIIFALIKSETWYNTIICYYLGILYFRSQSVIDKIKHRLIVYVISLLIFLISFGLYYFTRLLLFYEIWVVAFTILIIAFSSYFKIKNPVLRFLGKYSFEIYILQRLPMIIFQDKLSSNHLLYFMVSFGITIVLSLIYRWLFDHSLKVLVDRFSTATSRS